MAGWVANGVVINGGDPGQGIAVDAAGNSYVSGLFTGTISLGGATLTSNGSYDAFVTKVDPNGNFLWAKSFGGTSSDIATAIAVDAQGNAYVTGHFGGQVAFGSILVDSVGPRNAFVAKLAATGQFQWVARGGNQEAEGFAIATDSLGRVFTVGRFNGSGDFAGVPISNDSGDPADIDAFAVALDTLTGAPLWVKTRGGPGMDSSNGVAVDSQNNVFLTWADDMDPQLPDRGLALLSKLNPATGEVVWDHSLAPLDLEPRYNGRIALGEDAGGVSVYVIGNQLLKVADIDASGHLVWQRSLPADAVATDNLGNVYGVGNFFDGGGGAHVDFDTGPGQAILTAYNSFVRYTWKLNSAGEFLDLRGSEAPSGAGYLQHHGVAVDASGNIYSTGAFEGHTPQFDIGTEIVPPSSPTSGTAMFVLKSVQQRGGILGHVFNDLDNDGAWDFGDANGDGIWNRNDTGEPSLAGATVYIDANQNGQYDSEELTAVVKPWGEYRFPHVLPGDHQVRVLLPAGFSQTSPEDAGGDPIGATVSVSAGQSVTDVDFGASASHQTTNYVSSDVPKSSPKRYWQVTQSKLSITDSYPIFGIDLSITATSTQTRLTLIAPNGARIGVVPGVTHLNDFNYTNIQGTWTLELGTFDPWPSYSVTAWSMTVVGQTAAPPSPPPAGFTVTPTGGLVTYEDQTKASATFTIVLTRQPLADVTIGISSTNTSEGLVSLTNSNFTAATSLTFTPSNWSTPRTVYVKGVNDTVVDGNLAYTIDTAPSVSNDAAYNGRDVPNVAVTNNDNDRKGKIALTADAIGHNRDAQSISTSDPAVQAVLQEALQRWQAAGADVTALHHVPILVASLPGKVLAQTDLETIWIDADAAGWGWYLDPNPADDVEFLLPGDQGEQNRMDLLSAVLHEFGHLLDLDHDHGGPMQETLSAGMRTSLELSLLDAAWVDYAQSLFGAAKKRRVQT